MRPDASAARPAEFPDVEPIRRALTGVAKRATAAHGMEAAAAALAVAAIVFAALGGPSRRWAVVVAAAAGCAAAVLVFRRSRPARTMDGASRAIERTSPACKNVVITAAELLRHPDRATPRMRARVFREAASHAAATRAASAVPLGRPALLLAGAVMVAATVAGLLPRMASEVGRAVRERAGPPRAAAAPLTVLARVEPPAYTGQPAKESIDPDRIDAVEGSVLHLVLRGGDGDWRVRFGAKPLTVNRGGTEASLRAELSESGYLAIEAGEPAEASRTRRLVAVSVTPDRAPVIRIERPGRDLLLPDARGSVALAAAATDDFGLQSLELRYTKVSGSGEQFEFEEGSLPIAVARPGERSWTAQADLALAALKLEPGDALVYRAVARDRRPGDAGMAASDTYFIEIAAPGQPALEGFALPPERERYALSQQMILLKLQRLKAREASLARPALEEETAAIAAEQRAVRANFIFLMGGTVEDEEVEAEHSHEIQEGRLENTARKEISTAIHHMSRVEQALAAVSATLAIPPARAAVDALQRAFGRNRYILRMLSTRSRIDPTRRLTGELSAASDWQREPQPASLGATTRDARALAADVLGFAAALAAGAADAGRAGALSERALAIDPASAEWQNASKRLAEVRDGLAAGRPTRDLLRLLDETLPAVLARAQKDARPAPPAVAAPGALLGSWAGREKQP